MIKVIIVVEFFRSMVFGFIVFG